MKKTIYFLVFLLLLSFTHAALTDKLIGSYKLDTTGKYEDSSGNDLNLTAVGSPNFLTSAKINGGYYMDGNDAWSLAHSTTKLTFGKNMTISFWINSTDDTGYYIYKYQDANNKFYWFTDDDGSNYMWFESKTTTSCSFYTRDASLWTSGWKMLTVVYNYDDCSSSKIYLNTTSISFSMGADNNNIGTTNTGNLLINYNTAVYVTGSYDNINIWNRSLTPTEITELWNNGVGLQYPFGGAPPAPQPTLTLNTNLINNTANMNDQTILIGYNGTTANANTDIFNCSIYDNQTVLNTSFNVNLSITQYFNYSFGDVEKTFLFKVNCSNYEANASKGFYTYKVDTVTPIIKSDFVNGSSIYVDTTQSFYVNFSDSNLYAYNITWFSPENLALQNLFAENTTSKTFEQNTSTRLMSTVGNKFYIRAEVWDSHTSTTIKNYKIEPIQDGVKIENNLLIYSKDVTISLSKQKDRYNFNLENLDQKQTKKTIIIESDQPLKIIDSKYPGHIIDFNNKKWIDFQSSDISDVQALQINDKKIEVTIMLPKDKKETVIESIGDLNYQSQEFYFDVVSDTINILREINQTTHLINNTVNSIYLNSQNNNKVIQMNIILLTLVAFIFWLVYIASNISTKSDAGQIIQGSVLLKLCLFSVAGFIGFFVIQLVYNMAMDSGLFSEAVLKTLFVIYSIVLYVGIIILTILLIGIFVTIFNIFKNTISLGLRR